MRAQFGAQGTGLGGSVLDILADQAAEAEQDALLIEFAGEQSAIQQELNANLFRKEGQAHLIGGAMTAGKSLLSTAFLVDQAGGLPSDQPTISGMHI